MSNEVRVLAVPASPKSELFFVVGQMAGKVAESAYRISVTILLLSLVVGLLVSAWTRAVVMDFLRDDTQALSELAGLWLRTMGFSVLVVVVSWVLSVVVAPAAAWLPSSECRRLLTLFENHPELQPYRRAVLAQGRQFTVGELDWLDSWVREQADIKKKAEQKARDAAAREQEEAENQTYCRALYGMEGSSHE